MKLPHTATGDGPSIVILHGLFGSSRNWAGIAKILSATRRVYTLDARNHGESPWADSMAYAEMAADVAEFLAAEGIQRPVVMGHSMGGKTAMTLALGHGALVGGLVVADIAPVGHDVRFTGHVEAMRALDLATVARRADADSALADAVPEAGVRGFLLHNLATEDGGYRWRLNLDAIAANAEALAGFDADGSFDGPAVFIRGAESDYIQPAHHEVIHRLFPAAEIHDIPGAGHWLHADQPEAFVACLRAFLDRV